MVVTPPHPMKDIHTLQHAGIWLDGHHAILVANAPGNETHDFMIETRLRPSQHAVSGSEHSQNHTQKGDHLHFFKEVAAALLPYDEILVIGPGTAQEQLLHFLQADNHFTSKKITLGTASQLPDHELIDRVRSFFAPSTF